MQSSFFNKSVLGVLLIGALTLSACAKKEDSFGDNARVTAPAANGVTANDTTAAQACGSDTSKLWGKIYGSSAGNNFEIQVKAFVSATLNPNELGSISGDINAKTGVDFKGLFKFDSANQLVADASSIAIKIFDSYANTTQNGQFIPPYEFSFSKAKSGSINRNTRQINVVFEDEYGSITINGSYNDLSANGTVNGVVTFKNYKAVSGYTPQSGTLGSFTAYACAMIQ